jgi:hypothetical protein
LSRRAFAHDAVVALTDGGDPNAPGGAITVALCGHWEHEPPCPLAPHHTAATADGDSVRLRILFAAKAVDEQRVRALIEQALASAWPVHSSSPSPVRPDEADHAARLVAD